MVGVRKLGMTIALVGSIIGVMATAKAVQAEDLRIGAAPTLRAALDDIVPMFEKEYGVSLEVVYKASPILRRQIEQGAEIDVFLPAALEEVEYLQDKKLTLNGGHQIYAQTSLVLVMSATSQVMPVSFNEAWPNRATRIALGDPNASSLGKVTAQALTNLDSTYTNRSNIIHAEHAEDIVNLIHTGKVDLGIIYRADAINNPEVRIIDEAPAGVHVPVQFGQAVVSTCREESYAVAKNFFDFILSPRIQKLLLKYGFDYGFDSIYSNKLS